MNPAGIWLFNYAPETKLDPSIFSSFITTLSMFSTSMSGSDIDEIKLGDNYIHVFKDPETKFSIICRSKQPNEKKLDKILKEIWNKFNHKYSKDQIINWDGDTSTFENFKSNIDSYFSDKK